MPLAFTSEAEIRALIAAKSPTYLAYDAYSAGSAYSLTGTPAALTFGTTQPSITIAVAGTYRIRGRVVLQLNGASFASNRTVTLKFRRTNNTAADLTNGSTSLLTGIVTALTGPLATITIPEVEYVSAAGDVITIFGDTSALPSIGSLDAVQASIHAQRVA